MSTQTDNLLPLIRELYSRLFTDILTETKSEDADFFTNTDTVMYWMTPVTSSVMAADSDTLLLDNNPMREWLVNQDIVSTYLNTGELGLVGAVGGNLKSAVIGAFDRSTGIGLYYGKDWLNSDRLKEEVDNLLEDKSYEMPYIEVIPKTLDPDSATAKRSVVRLRNLLSDCRSHQLTNACGFEVQLNDSDT